MEGTAGAKALGWVEARHSRALRKVSAPAVMRRTRGQTLQSYVLMSRAGEGWVRGVCHVYMWNQSLWWLHCQGPGCSWLPPGTPGLSSSTGPLLLFCSFE